MIEVDVSEIRFSTPTDSPLLLLKETHGTRYLPIWLTKAQAIPIEFALTGQAPQRPSVHDAFANLLTIMRRSKLDGYITSVDDGVFRATVVIDDHTIDMRPSDVVALALRADFKVWCSSSVLDEVGVEYHHAAEDEVEAFKDFLDSVTPEDFDA